MRNLVLTGDRAHKIAVQFESSINAMQQVGALFVLRNGSTLGSGEQNAPDCLVRYTDGGGDLSLAASACVDQREFVGKRKFHSERAAYCTRAGDSL